jgi:hypothetical protein
MASMKVKPLEVWIEGFFTRESKRIPQKLGIAVLEWGVASSSLGVKKRRYSLACRKKIGQ